MRATPEHINASGLAFLTERHHASYSSLRADGTIHVTAVGFTFDPQAGLARVITNGAGQKAVNARDGVAATLCQIDGPRWLALEGRARVNADPAAVADAEARYARRYKQPRENPRRVVIELEVTRVLGSPRLLDR